MPNFISENDIEQAILRKLQTEHGYKLLNCDSADRNDLNDGSDRTSKRQVILPDRLKSAAYRLNPDIPQADIDRALAQLMAPRAAMTTLAANKEVDGLIRDGIDIPYETADGTTDRARIKVIGR